MVSLAFKSSADECADTPVMSVICHIDCSLGLILNQVEESSGTLRGWQCLYVGSYICAARPLPIFKLKLHRPHFFRITSFSQGYILYEYP